MSKKIIVSLIVILVLFILGGGFFWWWQKERETERIFVPVKDYAIQETSEGKFIENKKNNLKFKIPEGWKVEMGVDMFGFVSESKIFLYSPDYNLSPPQGCAVEIETIRMGKQKEGSLIKGAEEVRRFIKEIKEAKLENEDSPYKVIYVNSREALQEDLGKFIKVSLPVKERVYSFYFIQNSVSEKCLEKFDEFLNTVVIN